jgi:hypothetical protein
VIYFRKSTPSEPSKATEKKYIDVLAPSSMATASAPPPLAGVGLMACSYNDARCSTQRVHRYLDSLKVVEADREGNMASFTASRYLFFC